MSRVIEQLKQDLDAREKKGLETYGTTVDREDYSLKDWLLEAYYETLDKAVYLKAAINKIERDETSRESKENDY